VSRIDRHLRNLDLLHSHVCLRRLRNKHTALINFLPAEVLAEIFRLVVDQAQPKKPYGVGGPDIYQRTTTLTSVCYQWRCIALDARTLWSVVPLIRRACYYPDSPLVRLWLERSANTPVYLAFGYHVQPLTIIPMLRVHASRLRSLSVVVGSMDRAREIISCWLDHGAPGSVTELFVSSHNEFSALLPANAVPREHLDLFLRPLRVLHLCNVHFDWDCDIFVRCILKTSHPRLLVVCFLGLSQDLTMFI
jgi:hypothetical protein